MPFRTLRTVKGLCAFSAFFQTRRCKTRRPVGTGIRGANDLVWVGRAANYAAKLSSISEQPFSTFISEEIYDHMHDSVKFTNGTNMWEKRTWLGKTVYASSAMGLATLMGCSFLPPKQGEGRRRVHSLFSTTTREIQASLVSYLKC
jgi:hypothetical protein